MSLNLIKLPKEVIMKPIEHVETELRPLRKQIKNHAVYGCLSTIDDIKLFMEYHIFAVWDFMSLLKALQGTLTNTTVPWTPKGSGAAARFINEIVMGEESDVNEHGEVKSHFEMYIDSMDQIQANTHQIKIFLKAIENGASVSKASEMVAMHPTVKSFINFTFGVISIGKPHCIAAAFTFGREDVIPDMFLEIIQQSKTSPEDERYSELLYYLNRHIEVDEGEHGPAAERLLDLLCDGQKDRIERAHSAAEAALRHRMMLWEGILADYNRYSCETEKGLV